MNYVHFLQELKRFGHLIRNPHSRLIIQSLHFSSFCLTIFFQTFALKVFEGQVNSLKVLVVPLESHQIRMIRQF